MTHPLQRTLAPLSLAALLLLPAHLPAQTEAAPELDAAAARATCEAEYAAGHYAQALPACQAVLRSAEKLLGPEDASVGRWLLMIGRAFQEGGRYAEAVPLVQRALRIFQKVHGEQHPDVATSLNNLALLYEAQGQYAPAEPLYKRSLGILEKALGPDHPDVAASLNNLALLYQAQGQYAQAEPLYKRSLGISEKALGPGHPDVAASLNNLAALYQAQGQYAQAEPLYKRSLGIYEKALGTGHPHVATSLNNLAGLYQAQGQYAQAEPLYQRSLDLREKALGPGHPHVATSLNNLGELYRAQGQYAQAEPLLQRSLGIMGKTLPAAHPNILLTLGNLAQLYLSGDTPSLALPHLLTLLDGSVQSNGLYAAYSLWSIEQLARLHTHLNHPAEATALYDRFLALLLASPAPAQPLSEDLADRLSTLLERAFFHSWLRRDYPRAEKFAAQVRGLAVAEQSAVATTLARMQSVLEATTAAQRRVLSLHARMSRDRVDDHARRLFAAAIQEVAAERVEEAARLLTEGLYLSEGHLRRRLGEAEVRAWLEVQRPYLELSFELARQHPESVALRRLAWLASLLSKGRSLDAETNKLRVLRSEGTMQRHAALALRLNTLSGQAQRLALGGQGGLALVDARQQQKQTEDLLLASMGELRVESLPEAWEVLRRVSDALPKGAVLVDYVDYVAPPLGDGGGEGTRRYLALLLWPGAAGERTQGVDLGEVATHQPAIERLLRDLRSPTSQPQAAGKDVYQRLLAPVVKAAGSVGTLYVVPDGALSLIPFDALVDEQGNYVLDGARQLRYLASGRDLLREYGAASGRPPLLLGDPDLQAAQAAAPAPSAKGPGAAGKGTRGDAGRAASLYASVSSLGPLAHARAEAEALGKKLYVTPLLGSAASEPRLREEAKAGIGPKILHLAMHGLFPDEALGPLGRGARSRIVPVDASLVPPAAPPAAPPPAEDALDPMLHSALVLAGAGRAQAEGDSGSDGVLTADEARTLSLEGTELTVLSACQTALGSLRGGNGVDGLRRAFLIAGSEAVVASLWRVSDPATRSLMTRYYELLIDQKRPRITALREAMKAMKRDRPHPYYWAPFVAIGRDEPLRPLGHVVPAAMAGK
jgi:CHAT domain-containing protein/Tfp pilus assembly protein PilF